MSFHTKIYKLLKFLGRKGAFWFTLSVFSGVALAGLEMVFSMAILVLLKSLGVLADAPLPFSLEALQLSPQFFVFALIALGVLRGAAQFFVAHSAQVTNEMISVRLKLLLFYETFRLKAGFLSLAETQSKANDLFPRATAFCHALALMIPSSIQATLLMGVMTLKAPRETLLGVVGVGVAGVFIHLANRAVRKISTELPLELYKQAIRLYRTVRNYFLLKALRSLGHEHQNLIRGLLCTSSMSNRSFFLVTASSVLPQIVGVLVIALLVLVHLNSPELTGVEFLAFLYLFIRLVQSFSTMATNFGSMNANLVPFKQAAKYFFGFDPNILHEALAPAKQMSPFGSNWRDFLAISPSLDSNKVVSLQAGEPPTIEFKSVCFSYQPNSPIIIKDLSFTVNPGEQLAIIGSSGSGKSTLLALTLGIIKPTRGQLLINNKEPEAYYSEPHSRVGYVGAEPFIIAGSLRENLLYGRTDMFSDDQIWVALDNARLADWLRETHQGLDLKLSENGEGLSTGQKQRLALARALLAQPSLLILDEISANLDYETESQIAQTIAELNGKCTTLIVSHREGLVKHVEKRIHL